MIEFNPVLDCAHTHTHTHTKEEKMEMVGVFTEKCLSKIEELMTCRQPGWGGKLLLILPINIHSHLTFLLQNNLICSCLLSLNNIP